MNTNTQTPAKAIDTKLIGFTTVAAILGMGFAAAMGASAATDTTLRERGMRGTCDPETHEAIDAAIESGDYDAWKELVSATGRGGRASDVVTKDNFDTFAAMHDAMEEGDYAKTQELRSELGLGLRPQDGSGWRGGPGRGAGMMQRGEGNEFGSGYRGGR